MRNIRNRYDNIEEDAKKLCNKESIAKIVNGKRSVNCFLTKPVLATVLLFLRGKETYIITFCFVVDRLTESTIVKGAEHLIEELYKEDDLEESFVN